MKRLIMLFISFIFSCAQNPEIVKVEVRKVDFEITSIFSIDCINFEGYFDEEVKISTTRSINKIKKIQTYLENLEADPENYFPDVRAKILIYYSNSRADTLCMSDIGILFNGKPVSMDKSIVNFVEDN